MLEVFEEIDTIQLSFSEEGKTILNCAIAFIMFGVALELKLKDFIDLWKKPKPVLVGILSQFVLMPGLTFIIALSLSEFITPTIGLGMILVAACPGGNVSNFISALAKGNIALSVSLTAFSSFGGILLTPLNFTFWGNLFLSTYAGNADPGLIGTLEINVFDVMTTVALILGLPLIAGMWFNSRYKLTTQKVLPYIKKASIAVFIGIILIIFSKNFNLFVTYIPYIFFIVLVHNALAIGTGYGAGQLFKLKNQDCLTLGIETGIQNSGLALALLFNPNIFPADAAIGGMTFIAAWWGIWHIISGLSIAGIVNKHHFRLFQSLQKSKTRLS